MDGKLLMTSLFRVKSIIAAALLIVNFSIMAQEFGHAKEAKKSSVLQMKIDRAANSEALIFLEGSQTSHFNLDNPENVTAYGSTAPLMFVNGAEYYKGKYYGLGYNDPKMFSVDPVTGQTETVFSTFENSALLSYNPQTDVMYGVKLDPNSAGALYTIDMETGTETFVANFDYDGTIICFEVMNNGRIIAADSKHDLIIEIDPQSGNVTPLFSAGFNVTFGQDMAVDRETNTLYWAAYNYDASRSELYIVDLNKLSLEFIGAFEKQASGFAIKTDFTPTSPSGVEAVTLTEGDTPQKVVLAWTNPSLNLQGQPLTDFTKLQIFRNGTLVHEIENPEVGAQSTWTDNVPSAGRYFYSFQTLSTTNIGSNIGKMIDSGSWCDLTFNMGDGFGDGWNGAEIRIVADNIPIGNIALLSGSSGTATLSCPSSALKFYWASGAFDGEISFSITDSHGEVVFTANGGPSAGEFFSWTNNCNGAVCNPVTNVTFETTNANSGVVKWEQPSGDVTNLTGYKVVGVGLFETVTLPADQLEYSFTSQSLGSDDFSICVTAIYTDCESEETCVSIPVGISEIKDGLSVYPNPAKDYIYLSGINVVDSAIYNAAGQLVKVGGNETAIDVSNLSKGVYLLVVTTPDKKQIRRKIAVNR